MIAIDAYIDEMKRGNYEYRRELRRHDELGPILDNLKQLSRQLKEAQAEREENGEDTRAALPPRQAPAKHAAS